jgi:hypothetical protein
MSSFTSTPRDLNPVLASPDLPGPSGLSQSSRDIPLSALPPKKRIQRRLDMTQGPQDTTPTVTETEEELIANRTRSKFPIELSLEELEAAFKAPDWEPSQDDSHIELDEEDVQWRAWLDELMHGVPPAVSDSGDIEEDDQDYNFLADQGLCLEEVEEYRNDKAVKIPEQEVSALIEELLGTYGDGEQTSEGISTPFGPPGSVPMQLDPFLSASLLMSSQPTEPKTHYLSQDQVVELHTQIQQYFQLLMQSFVLARFEPSLVFLSQIAAKAVEELGELCGKADTGQESAVWSVPDVQSGLQIVQAFNPYETITIHNELQGVPKPPVSDLASSIMFNCPLFSRFKQLLPKMGYAPLTSVQLSKTSPFTQTEDNLLVIGMHRFGSNNWKDICFFLLPTKTTSQLKNHVKNLCAQKKKNNIIKSYKKTGKLVLTTIPEDNDPPQWFKLAYENQKASSEPQTTPTPLAPKPPSTTPDGDKSSGTSPLAIALEGTPLVASGMPPEKAKVIEEQLNRLGLKLKLQASPRKPTCTHPPLQPKPTSNLSTTSGDTAPSRADVQTTPVVNSVVSSKLFRRNVHRKSPMRAQKRKKKPIRGLDARKLAGGSSGIGENDKMVSVLAKAGADSSNPHSHFMYGYMLQVKSELTDSPEVYDKFLKVLMDSDKSGLSPAETFGKVQDVLKSWPHLVKVFSDFLQPQEAKEAKVFKDKVSIGWGKVFVAKLEKVFSANPGRIEELMAVLSSTDEDCPKEKLRSEIMPLFDGHEELLEEFLGYLSGLPPSRQEDDVYETVVLSDSCDVEELCAGDMERVVIVPQSEEGAVGVKEVANKEHAVKASKPPAKRPRGGEPSTSHNLAKRKKVQSVSTASKQPSDQDQAAKGDESSSSKTDTPAVREWTKDEDKVILGSSADDSQKGKFEDIAKQLQRAPGEVEKRFEYLMEQYQRLLQQHQGES